MVDVIRFIYKLFQTVLQTSVTASILIVLILIIRKLTKGKLGIKFQYSLWFIIILRLMIPNLPESTFSVFNLISKIKITAFSLFTSKEISHATNIEFSGISTIYNKNTILNGISSLNYIQNEVTTFNFSIVALLALIWLTGTLTICMYIFIINKKLKNKLQNQPALCTGESFKILESCKSEMKIKKNILLTETQKVKTPALFGVFKPRILLPENIISMISTNKLRYVFLHELAHYKRKDILMNWVISILRIIHWFNPIVQYGLKKMTEDMEMCCDCLALSYTKDEEVKEYGLTMINLIESLSKPVTILGTTSMVNNKSVVRRRIIMIKLFNKKAYKFSALAIASLLVIGGVALTDATVLAAKKSKAVNIDKTDYPFVSDLQIVGKWQSVDFVENIADFKVDSKKFKDDLFIKELNFTSEGKVSKTVFTWTKDHILNPVDKTDSSYEIKDINGSTYMFFQWKSGDYTIRGMQPQYYVLKKVDSTPSLTTNSSGKEVTTQTDKIDYPFVNDPEILGDWISVDFIEHIEDFKPNAQFWKGDLYINNLTFKENGKIKNKKFTWTKDHILNPVDKTDSSYLIKEIDGTKYMFFQWKNGDYVERGATPWYYVLKQDK